MPSKHIESEKLKERRMRVSKRAQFEGGFSNARSGGGSGRPQQGQRLIRRDMV